VRLGIAEPLPNVQHALTVGVHLQATRAPSVNMSPVSRSASFHTSLRRSASEIRLFSATVGVQLIYALAYFILLAYVDRDAISLDGWRRGR
jgi:hypothetical protein